MDDTRKKRDYLFVYMMILALVLFVVGFYLGGVIVKNKYSEQISALTEELNKDPEERKIKYLQTDFVSFYYGVLEPFNKLKAEHFSYVDRINQKDRTFDYNAKTKDLLEYSKTVLAKINETVISDSAPLLLESKQNYVDSLLHYQKGIGGLLNNSSMPQEIEKFNTTWLLAQKQFYQSVLEWEKMYSTKELEPLVLDIDELYSMSFRDWDNYSLHQKNYIVSALLEQNQYLIPYQPEDITIHIDPLARSNELNTFGIQQIGQALDLLLASNAIHTGDYQKEKDRFYSNVETPLIPLYLTK